MRTGRHVVLNLHAHLVIVTKYRRKAFTDTMPTRTEEVMREACTDFEAELKQFNGEQDHVRRYLRGGHFRSGSYFAGSCSGGTADPLSSSTSKTSNAPSAEDNTADPCTQRGRSSPELAFTPAVNGRALAKIKGRRRSPRGRSPGRG